MSGPKVVRIVTREEIEAICRTHLRAVDAALAALGHCAENNGVLDDTLEASLLSRHDALQRLFDTERWLDLQKQAPLELAFLGEQQRGITAAAVEQAERARRTRRRLSDAARSLVMALEAAGKPIASSLRQAATGLDQVSNADISAIETELSAALVLLRPSAAQPGTTYAVTEFASRLQANEKAVALSDWLLQQPARERDSIRRLDRAIAEARVLDPQAAVSFTQRAAAIEAERSPDHQALLADSLVLDMASHLQRVRDWDALAPSLVAMRDTLQESHAPTAELLLQRLDRAMAAKDPIEGALVFEAAQALTTADAKRRASHARRVAVLNGLAALGYEVREHMATAWARSGRIVLKKPGALDYGIELGAVADGERVQMQVVGAAEPAEARTAARDREAETIFCGHVSDLQAALGGSGTQLAIERALPIGAQPVKTVAFADAVGRGTDEVASPLQRRLP